MDRRRFLTAGGAAVGAGLFAAGTGVLGAGTAVARPDDGPGTLGHCASYPAIQRTWIGASSGRWPVHNWTHYTPAGGNGHNTSGRHNGHFNSATNFHGQCSRWAVNYSDRLSNVGHAVAWFGTLGTGNCNHSNPDSLHRQARAFDLTRIQYTDGVFVDMNWSWRPHGGSVKQKRRYLAVAAHLRWYFKTVITAWHNSAHHNHIHFDDGLPIGPLRAVTGNTDVILFQAAYRLLVSSTIAMDGVWGSATEAAYQEMLRRFDMTCLNPKTSTAHARTFWTLIARHGFYDVAAGHFTHGC